MIGYPRHLFTFGSPVEGTYLKQGACFLFSEIAKCGNKALMITWKESIWKESGGVVPKSSSARMPSNHHKILGENNLFETVHSDEHDSWDTETKGHCFYNEALHSQLKESDPLLIWVYMFSAVLSLKQKRSTYWYRGTHWNKKSSATLTPPHPFLKLSFRGWFTLTGKSVP